jgi:hypothetical protein
MATHPQHSGKKLSDLKFNPFPALENFDDLNVVALAKTLEEEFFELKKLSLEIGCSNPKTSLFHIRHIFTDTASNQLDFINKKIFYNEQINFEYENALA